MKWYQKQWVQALIVFLAAFTVYANNIANDWAYDDIEYITENSFITEPGHSVDIFTTSYLYGSGGKTTGLYRPLTVFSYALNRQITGMDPAMFHLVNDLIHAACSLAFLWLLATLGFGALAFPGALLFALHPVHTEAVSNVVGRAELLSCLFMLVSLALFLSPEIKRRITYPLALLFFLFALLSKEIPAVLPVILLAGFGAAIFRGDSQRGKRELLEIFGYFAVLAAYMLLRHAAIARSGVPADIMMQDNPLWGMPFFVRLPAAFSIIARYMLLLLLPLRLSADYSYNQVPLPGSLFAPWALAGLVCAVGMTALWALSLGKSRKLTTAALMFGLPLLFISNIPFTFGTIMGERLLYIPSAGFIMLLLLAGQRMFSGNAKKNIAVALLAVLSLFYAGRTFVRNFDWKDNATLFAATAETSPNSVKNCYNYALSLRQQGRLTEAVDWYRRAVAIWPEHRNAWFNLGNTLADLKRYPEAAAAYEKADALVPNDVGTLHNLALTYRNMGDTKKAVATFEHILSISADKISPRMNIADAWREAGDYGRALAALESVAGDDPGNVNALVNIGNIHLLQDDAETAESYYKKALEKAPDNPVPNNALLALLVKGERMEEADAEYARMRNNKIPVMRQLAELLERR